MNRQLPDHPIAAPGLRLFVAVPLPAGVVARATAIVTRLADRAASVRWIAPQRLHLTLAFLGDLVPEQRVPVIAAALDRACRGFGPLVFACGGLGRFPPAGRPRVIWLGVTHGEAALVRLQAAVAGALEPLGFPQESRGWQPHVTLGRVSDQGRSAAAAASRLAAVLADHADCDGGSGIIDAVVLYASVRTPAGAAYRAVHVTPLASQ